MAIPLQGALPFAPLAFCARARGEYTRARSFGLARRPSVRWKRRRNGGWGGQQKKTVRGLLGFSSIS